MLNISHMFLQLHSAVLQEPDLDAASVPLTSALSWAQPRGPLVGDLRVGGPLFPLQVTVGCPSPY